MSSDRVGVQKVVRDLAPKATYVHCHGHCLNLVIAKACSIPEVRSVIDRLQSCCRFFLNSPKRNGALELIVETNVSSADRRKPLLGLCKTRWAERHSAYQHFYQGYVFIVHALEMIGYKQHLQKYGDKFADWDPGNRSDAQQLLASITSSSFIVGFMALYQYLSHLSGLTVKLQRRSLDILEAYQLVSEVKATYRSEQQSADTNFKTVFDQCERLAKTVDCAIAMRRIAGRQQHRSNPESCSAFDYFKKVIATPLLDYIVTALDERFSRSALVASTLLGLVPSVVCKRETSLTSVTADYKDDMASPELLPAEISRWKARYLPMPEDLRPASPAQAIADCDRDSFPNIFSLLQIACTIPVTSCECERSASALRRLHNYMRACVTTDRLSSLALLHIHYDAVVDVDEAVSLFARLHPRRLQLDPALLLRPH